jgi:hypothetical protein
MKFNALLIAHCSARPLRDSLGVALALPAAGAMAAIPLQAPDARRMAPALSSVVDVAVHVPTTSVST